MKQSESVKHLFIHVLLNIYASYLLFIASNSLSQVRFILPDIIRFSS